MSKRVFLLGILVAVIVASAVVGQASASLPYTREITPSPDVQCSGAQSNEYFTSFLWNTSNQTINVRRYWIDGNNQKIDLGDPPGGFPLSPGTSASLSLVKRWPTNIVTEGFEIDRDDPNVYIGQYSDRCRY